MSVKEPQPSRAKEFVDMVIRKHGCRRGDEIVVPYSQADLARLYNVSSGTVHWYLEAMGDVVVERRPCLVFSANAFDGGLAESPSLDHEDQPAVIAVRGDLPGGSVLALLDRIVGIVERLVDAPAGQSRDAATESRLAEAAAPGSLAESREHELLESFIEAELDKQLLDTEARLSEAQLVKAQAEAAPTEVAEPREPSTPIPGDGSVGELLAPLDRLVAERQLTGVTDPVRLMRALQPYSPAEIAGAVERVCIDLRRGTKLRSPYGLLVARAEAGDRSLFAPIPSHPAGPPPPSLHAPVAATDETVETSWETDFACIAVDEMESDPDRFRDRLRALDVLVEAQFRIQNPTMVDRMMASAPLRHAMRIQMYRGSTERPAGAEATVSHDDQEQPIFSPRIGTRIGTSCGTTSSTPNGGASGSTMRSRIGTPSGPPHRSPNSAPRRDDGFAQVLAGAAAR